jgi:hypothetical protein
MISTTAQAKLSWKRMLVAAASCLCLVGCSSGSLSTEQSGQEEADKDRVFHVSTEMDQIVKDAIEEFPEPLPSNVQWLHETPVELKQPNTKYEEGVAEGVVTFYWLCAWEKSFLDAFHSGDQSGQSEALAMVERRWWKSSNRLPGTNPVLAILSKGGYATLLRQQNWAIHQG